MASELSQLIEDELRHKGYYHKDDKADEEAPHQALMGALRVEVSASHTSAHTHMFGVAAAHSGQGPCPGDA